MVIHHQPFFTWQMPLPQTCYHLRSLWWHTVLFLHRAEEHRVSFLHPTHRHHDTQELSHNLHQRSWRANVTKHAPSTSYILTKKSHGPSISVLNIPAELSVTWACPRSHCVWWGSRLPRVHLLSTSFGPTAWTKLPCLMLFRLLAHSSNFWGRGLAVSFVLGGITSWKDVTFPDMWWSGHVRFGITCNRELPGMLPQAMLAPPTPHRNTALFWIQKRKQREQTHKVMC